MFVVVRLLFGCFHYFKTLCVCVLLAIAWHYINGINCQDISGYRVTRVTEKNVEVFDKKTGQTAVYPTGLVVWSTGIAPVPLTKGICKSLPEQCNKYGCIYVC